LPAEGVASRLWRGFPPLAGLVRRRRGGRVPLLGCHPELVEGSLSFVISDGATLTRRIVDVLERQCGKEEVLEVMLCQRTVENRREPQSRAEGIFARIGKPILEPQNGLIAVPEGIKC
jgi:hypothetical protein